ncbi:hypothetical protein [Mycobacterium tilburgii]|uniref:hypothetical protein n=1 Tax=Mycobacterium tilburgii TaxID=44467 RepID=UPI0021B3362C|nr:hypothetical protein [Mycobacterium tilburgii]
MLLFTNCIFDGVVYNPQRVMEEVLAIKPDICFLWDEGGTPSPPRCRGPAMDGGGRRGASRADAGVTGIRPAIGVGEPPAVARPGPCAGAGVRDTPPTNPCRRSGRRR